MNSNHLKINNQTGEASSYAENFEVGELVVSIVQDLDETVIWSIAEQDIPSRWNWQSIFLGRIHQPFRIAFTATRYDFLQYF